MKYVGIVCKNCGNDSFFTKGNKNGKKDLQCKKCRKRTYISLESLDPLAKGGDEKYRSECDTQDKKEFTQNNNVGEGYVQSQKPISTENELKEASGLDEKEWIIRNGKYKAWSVPYRKKDEEEMSYKQMYSVGFDAIKRKPDQQVVPVIYPIRLEMNISDKNIYVNKSKNRLKKTIVCGDAQIGFERNIFTGKLNSFHDRLCINNLLKSIRVYQPDEVILLGDLLDFTEASKYEKKPEFYFTLQPAINEFAYILTLVRNIVPKAKIVLMRGNHETRIDRKVNEHMLFAYQLRAYKAKTPIMSLSNLLGLENLNIELIEDYPGGKYFINENLKVIHGEFVNLKKELEKTSLSFIMGHIHKIYTETKTFESVNDKLTTTMGTSCGCLSKIDGTVPGVTKKPNWQNGFIKVESNDTQYNLSHIYIDQGKSIFEGEIIQGNDYENEIKDLIYTKE